MSEFTDKIDIHTFTDKTTVDYVVYMWQTAKKLALRPETLALTVYCTGPKAADKMRALLSDARIVIAQNTSDGSTGSDSHAQCLNTAFKEISKTNVSIVCDSDTVIIARGWDDKIRKLLLTDSTDIAGVTYEDEGGSSSGRSTVQTYKMFPNVVWTALSPRIDWTQLDCSPRKSKNVKIWSAEDSELYHLPVGHEVLCDVGWQLPSYCRQRGARAEAWRHLKPSRGGVVTAGLSDYHEEFHFDGEPFVVHQRGSRNKVFKSDRKSRHFYDTVEKYVESRLSPSEPVPVPAAPTKYAENDTKKWIKISHNGRASVEKTNLRDRVETHSAIVSPREHAAPGHVRIEGCLPENLSVTFDPPDRLPYTLTIRNAADRQIRACLTADRRHGISIPPDSVVFALVDVDGVFRVE